MIFSEFDGLFALDKNAAIDLVANFGGRSAKRNGAVNSSSLILD